MTNLEAIQTIDSDAKPWGHCIAGTFIVRDGELYQLILFGDNPVEAVVSHINPNRCVITEIGRAHHADPLRALRAAMVLAGVEG